MRLKKIRSQSITVVDLVCLILAAVLILGFAVPMPDWNKVRIMTLQAREREMRWDATNRVRTLWQQTPSNIVELDLTTVPANMSNTVVELNSHHFRLTFAPDIDIQKNQLNHANSRPDNK